MNHSGIVQVHLTGDISNIRFLVITGLIKAQFTNRKCAFLFSPR